MLVYSFPCEIDRLSVDNWFSNFIIVLIFSLAGLSMVSCYEFID